MIRIASTVLFLALVPLAAAQDSKKPNLYPLQLGNKWEFLISGDGGSAKVEVVAEVTAVESKNGRIIATITATTAGQKSGTEQVSSDEHGVYRNGFPGLMSNREFPIIKYPVKIGDTWKESLSVNGMEAELTFAVGEAEEVTVTAGKFKAIPFQGSAKIKGQETSSTRWFADGVGIVQDKLTFGGRTFTRELKKFTPGK